MNRKALITTIIIVLALLGVGAYALTRNSDKDNTAATSNTTSTDTTAPSSDQSNPSNSGETKPATATITYTNNGFSPATLTVKVGTVITIKNDSSMQLQFDSNPHPAHTDDPELNVGSVAPGSSGTFTVTTTGTHGYHNHLNSSDTGTIVVQ